MYVPYLSKNFFHRPFLFNHIELNCPGDGSCSNEGNCDETTGTCICNFGFEGSQCEGTYMVYQKYLSNV